ncbi:MAG: hypothetical protein NVS3B10_21400 [Polyangiales bacterium]
MITVGCAGFAVPLTRYVKEFMFVEVQETHLSSPGRGTLGRWKRQGPEGFEFALLGPREVGQEGFREGKVVETALHMLGEVADELSSRSVIFIAPPDFPQNKANRAVVKEFLGNVRKRFDRVVWEAPPAWDPEDALALALEAGAVASRDPLSLGTYKAKFGYYRLPGPAGHKSRYEDPALERLAEIVKVAKHETSVWVFTNVDMFADAKRLKKLLKL